jgi:hypothetical protein
MADTKISALDAAGALAGTEEVPVVQSGATRRATAAAVAAAGAPKAHKASHQSGGADAISIAGLSGEAADAQKTQIMKAAVAVGTRAILNFIEGTGVSLTVADDAGNGRVNITIAASGATVPDALPLFLGENFS